MTSDIKIAVKENILKKTHIDETKYKKMYEESINNPEKFWAEQAARLTWFKKWDKVNLNPTLLMPRLRAIMKVG